MNLFLAILVRTQGTTRDLLRDGFSQEIFKNRGETIEKATTLSVRHKVIDCPFEFE